MMFHAVLCVSLAGWVNRAAVDGSIESDLIRSLTNDANLDLPMDTEYEDLRAELLAYHTALASLVDSVDNGTARRNIRSKPCWEQGGICVRQHMCEGHVYRHQVPGCKDRNNVCCFAWNQYKVRDQLGLAGLGYPWSKHQQPFQGKGVVFVTHKAIGKKRKSKKAKTVQLVAEDLSFDVNDGNRPKRLENVRPLADGLVVLDID